MDFSITQLEYLCALARSGNFGEAARKLGITQPTLSMQIQKLEQDLGVILFDRSRQPVVITQAGESYLAQAQVILRECELFHRLNEAEGGELRGEFVLAIIPTISPFLVPLFLPQFFRSHPKAELKVVEMKTPEILAQFREEGIDGAVLATPPLDSPMLSLPLYYEKFFAYLPPGHKLLKKSEVAMGDLRSEELLLLEEGHCINDQSLKLCTAGGREKIHRGVYKSGNLELLRRLVEKGEGATLIPELMVLDNPALDHQLIRPFQPPMPAREISLLSSRHQQKRLFLQGLKRTIIESIPPAMATPTGLHPVPL